MSIDLKRRYTEILAELAKDSQLSSYLNPRLKIPAVYRGSGPIRLIILGQDPTVKDRTILDQITQVLDLRGHGPLHNYVKRICLDLGLDLDQNIYATNLVKNFFVAPPTQIKQVDVLALAAPYWLPVLREELAEFPDAPVISLGDPLLRQIVNEGAPCRVRDYWDYNPEWKTHPPMSLRYLEPNQNILNRIVFPLPHQQPFMLQEFYHKYLLAYLRFAKSKMATDATRFAPV